MTEPKLSAAARSSLEERLRELEEERIPRLEEEATGSDDPATVATLADARAEAARLRTALARAGDLEDEPHDPSVVELGDTVLIAPEDGGELESYTLTGDLEARVDDSWISVGSPLGAALIGARVGEVVEVRAPGGTLRYRVVEIRRD